MTIIQKSDELLFVTARGTLSRQKASGISTQGRYAKGVRIQRVASPEQKAAFEKSIPKH